MGRASNCPLSIRAARLRELTPIKWVKWNKWIKGVNWVKSRATEPL
jgi:hypothetical protein